MNFLPYENITYSTALPESEVLRLLEENVEPPKFRFFGGKTKDYEGRITENKFNISRIIGYRNSFLPDINGEVGNDLLGTKINVKMQINPVVTVFVSMFFLSGILFCLAALIISIFKSEFSFAILLGFIFPLFIYGMTMIGFKIESAKSRESLKNLFQAKIISG